MAFRPNRPGRQLPSSQARHSRGGIDLGGIGGVLASNGAESVSPNDEASSMASSSGNDASADNVTPSGGAYPVMSKPGFMANMFTHGQAGLDYNKALYEQALQQTRGAQALEQIGASGAQTRQNIGATGEQERKTYSDKQISDILKQEGIEDTPDNRQTFNDTMTQKRIELAAEKHANELAQTKSVGAGMMNPLYQSNVDAGLNANASSPAFRNMAEGRLTAGPLTVAQQSGFIGAPTQTATGAMPTGTTDIHSMVGPNGQVLQKTTDVSTHGYRPPSVINSQPLSKVPSLDDYNNSVAQGAPQSYPISAKAANDSNAASPLPIPQSSTPTTQQPPTPVGGLSSLQFLLKNLLGNQSDPYVPPSGTGY